MKSPSTKSSLHSLDLGCGLNWQEGSAADGGAFWALLGPLAVDGAVHKELGEPIVSTEHHRWLFGIDKSGAVVAAGALILPIGGKPAWLAYLYVLKAHRLRGICRAMMAHQINEAVEAGATSIRVVTRSLARPFAEMGFALSSQRGSWSYMEKAL